MRAKTRQLLIVKKFIKSNKREEIVEIKPNRTSIKTCLEKGLPIETIKLRLVRVELPNEVEVLITNLMDTETYEADLFKELYHLHSPNCLQNILVCTQDKSDQLMLHL